jgi:hypothetical protein
MFSHAYLSHFLWPCPLQPISVADVYLDPGFIPFVKTPNRGGHNQLIRISIALPVHYIKSPPNLLHTGTGISTQNKVLTGTEIVLQIYITIF